MSIWERAGSLLIAASLLFAALKIHKAKGKSAIKAIGCGFGFLSGSAFFVTIVGSWVAHMSGKIIGLSVSGLIVCVTTIVVDIRDKRPDKPAFWSAFALPFFLIMGITQLPAVGRQIGDGAGQVGQQIEKVNDSGSGGQEKQR